MSRWYLTNQTKFGFSFKVSCFRSSFISFRTPDEDFSILLEAAVMYDRRVAAALNEDDSIEEEKLWRDIHNGHQCLFPRLLFIITGMFTKKFPTYLDCCQIRSFQS